MAKLVRLESAKVGPPVLGTKPTGEGHIAFYEGAWGLPVPKLPRPRRYLVGRGEVIFVRPVKSRRPPRRPVIVLADQRRQVRGKVRLGKAPRLFGRPPVRPPRTILADQRRQVRGQVALSPVVRTFAPVIRTPRLLVKLVTRHRRFRGKIKHTNVFGGVISAPVVRLPRKPLSKLARQRRHTRGMGLLFQGLAAITTKPPVRRPTIKLTVRSRRYAGKGKVKPTSVYGSTTKPFNPLPNLVPFNKAYQRRQVRGRVRLGKPVRSFSAIVQPKRVPLRRLLAPQRRFVRGQVRLGKPIRQFSAIVEPKRNRIVIKLAAQRRAIRGHVQLGKVVRTFSGLNSFLSLKFLLNLARQREAVRGQVILGNYIATDTFTPPIFPVVVKLVPKRKETRGRVQLGKVVRTFAPPPIPNLNRLVIDLENLHFYWKVSVNSDFLLPLD